MIRSHQKIFLLVCFFIIFCVSLLTLWQNTNQDLLTSEERAWLNQNQDSIRLAPAPNWEPMEFVDKFGNYKGLIADYMKLIETKLNFRFRIVHTDNWSNTVDKAKSKQIDVLSAAQATEERRLFMNWTKYYVEFPTAIIVHKSFKKNVTLQEMSGMKVGVIHAYVHEKYLSENYPDLDIIPVESGAIGLKKLSFQEIDAMVMELPNAFYVIEQQKINNLRIAGIDKFIARYSIGVRNDWPILYRILEKGLSAISQSEKKAIYQKWIRLDQDLFYNKRSFWYSSAAASGTILLLSVFVIVWNRTLTKKVDLRTRELNEELEERKRAEEKNRKLELQLRQVQKMEALGTLAGGIAHDFNNILGSIIGNAELIELFDLKGNSRIESRIEQILLASNRAKDLVNQILMFSRKNEHVKKPIQIVPVMEETISFLKASLPSTIKVKVNIQNPDTIIIADPTQIHQLLMNLGTNAAHAMPNETGTLTIKLEDKFFNEAELENIIELTAGNYHCLTVSDTGCGMDNEVQENIFDPFFTTKEVGKGTGMGLAVIHGIVKSYNGGILVESVAGIGSSFKILIPKTDATISQGTKMHTLSPITGKGKILFIDDEKALADLGKEILESVGYQVTAETDSEKALHLFKSNPQAFSLVITDLTMPRLTGIQISEQIRYERPDIPIILCSGRLDSGMTKEDLEAYGIIEFIKKPINAHKLIEQVHKNIEKT